MAKVDCAAILKVLADPTRMRVVEILMTGPKHVGEINRTLRVDQSLLSHHLKVLRESKLVTAERDGKAVLYRLAALIADHRRGHTLDLGCCRLSFNPGSVVRPSR